jgi:prepilin-type N-terminal cleavage/methylation domain-containing protein
VVGVPGAMRDESGFTMTELLVSIIIFGIILTAILQMVQVTIGNQNEISQRVAANQRGRPVMTQIVNNLRSGCVTGGVAPVREGSTASEIVFYSKTGSSVSPIPERRIVTMSAPTGTPPTQTLTERMWAPTGGTPASPTFGTNPTSNRTLLTNVGPAKSGSTTLPVFRYYKLGYVSNKLVPVALTPPLDATEASETALVSIAFASLPLNYDVRDPGSAISFTDTVSLRLESGSPEVGRPSLPCA